MQTTATLAQELAGFARVTMLQGAPQHVRDNVVGRVIDIVGLAVAAAPLETSRAVTGMVAENGGAAQASVIGLDHRVPAAQAAFVNGVLAHSLDFDDTHLPSILHPSASVVPAALACSEHLDVSGPQLLDAIAIGIEVCVRVGMGGFDPDRGESEFFVRGQHATSICGALGAAAAAASLMDLDEGGIAHALGIAASFASGLLEGNRMGGTVKRMHCGWAASAGVTAANLAARGVSGPATVFEGRFGFFEAFIGGVLNASALTEGLGERWEVPGVFFKPYPANHFTHCAADAAMALAARGIAPDDIEALHIGVAASTVRTIGEPIEVKRQPVNGYQAQFSGPYVVTAALFGGSGLGLSLADFDDELVRDPVRRRVMERVSVGADPDCDAIFPNQFPAVLTAKLRDGSTVTERRMTNRGGSELPLSSEELATKFSDNVRSASIPEEADRIRQLLVALEGRAGVRDVLAGLSQIRFTEGPADH